MLVLYIKGMQQRERGELGDQPTHTPLASLKNVGDRDIVNWSESIAISHLSYYKCQDNLYQVRMNMIVDHQIRWFTIFTLAHNKTSPWNIVPKTQIL
ncbi:hypothetical protein Patl1_02304 [Pistacia atlantica]|uniref:Uncharacterized protein n=1 Tax=Pistacia atlantica TaxID=434234 RepID=A0ACC1CCZ0_9ROSI|nr:hypothetical protein Patl1_02304 [Pistacia atlantica]